MPRLKAPQRREQLIQVATRLFAERGYAATTTKLIAESAGVRGEEACGRHEGSPMNDPIARATRRSRSGGRWLAGWALALCVSGLGSTALAESIFDDNWTPPPMPRPVATDPAEPGPSDRAPRPPEPTPGAGVPSAKGAMPLPSAPLPPHRPVPAGQDQQRSRKLFKEVFAKELADPSPASRRALAVRLLKEADANADAPADQFVLLAAAIEAARQGSDLPHCLAAVDALAAKFDVDAARVKIDAALGLRFRADTPALSAANCRAGLSLVRMLADARDYATAAKLLAALRPAAAGDGGLVAEVAGRAREVAEEQADAQRLAQDRARLATDPDDPAAHLDLGQVLCFSRHEWPAGLPHLAKGNDPVLQTLAARDLANPTSTADRLSLGDDWWNAGEKRDPATRSALRGRAARWLSLALPQLKGLEKAVVENRVAEASYADAVPGALLRRFDGHKGPVTQVAFAPDGRSILSGGDDGTVRRWDLLSGKELGRFEGHRGPVVRLAAPETGGRFITSSLDHTVRVWDLEAARESHRFSFDSDCWSACISPDGRSVLFASNMTAPQLCSTTTFQPAAGFHGEGSYASAWCPNGRLFATGGYDAATHVYDAATLKEVARLKQGEHVYSLAFSPDGRLLVSSGAIHAVHVWDVFAGRELRRFDAGQLVRKLAFTADGRYVLAAGNEPAFVLWNPATGEVAHRFEGQEAGLRGVAVSKDGRLALTGGEDGGVRLWRLPDPRP